MPAILCNKGISAFFKLPFPLLQRVVIVRMVSKVDDHGLVIDRIDGSKHLLRRILGRFVIVYIRQRDRVDTRSAVHSRKICIRIVRNVEKEA